MGQMPRQIHQTVGAAAKFAILYSSGSFIPSASFTGSRPGFVFKNDAKGLGYYKDVPTATQAGPTVAPFKAPAKPVILKSKPIINIQKRSAGQCEQVVKKKKTGGTWPCLTHAWNSIVHAICVCSAVFLDVAEEEQKSHYQKEMERYRSRTCGSDTAHERPLVK
eukprot:scaffold668554_cov57-Prasinocladus_malaysianus.AAC.2